MFNLKRRKLRKKLEMVTEQELLRQGFIRSQDNPEYMFNNDTRQLYKRVWANKNYYRLIK